MEIVRKILKFSALEADLFHVYKINIKILLEQSSNVWHTGLSIKNENDLKHVQKVACKLILKEKYRTYENSHFLLGLDKFK